MTKGMETSIFWAIVWGVVFVLSLVAIWWNPCHIFTAIIAGAFMVAFIVDFVQYKRRK